MAQGLLCCWPGEKFMILKTYQRVFLSLLRCPLPHLPDQSPGRRRVGCPSLGHSLCAPRASAYDPGIRPLTWLQTSRAYFRAVLGPPGTFSGALRTFPAGRRIELCLHADRLPLPIHRPTRGMGFRHKDHQSLR